MAASLAGDLTTRKRKGLHASLPILKEGPLREAAGPYKRLPTPRKSTQLYPKGEGAIQEWKQPKLE